MIISGKEFITGKATENNANTNLLTIQVAIPCPGHASLIINELKKLNGVNNVDFRFPNYFDISYSPEKISKEEIISINIFKTYSAQVK